MRRLSTFPNVVIVGTSSLPICRFCKPSGLPESTISQPFTKPFTLRGIQVQKPLCASTSLHCENKSDQQDDHDDIIRPSLQRVKESLTGPFRVVKLPG